MLIQVPVVIWSDGRIAFSYAVNRRNEVVFTYGHGTGCGKGWVPVSTSLPSTCTPRPCLPTGEINTMEDYASIYFKDKIILGVLRRM